MHGQIAMNRRGRKRKSGRRTPAGALPRVRVDYRAMAACNPDRRWLPTALRLSERAGTVLGCLSLINRIGDDEYEAGRKYSVLVGEYLVMAGAPRGTAGNGRGYDCIGSLDCPPETCICKARTEKYMRANEAIEKAAGRAGHMAVNKVAIHDELCSPAQFVHLRNGLRALARHFGLTNQRKS